MMRAERPARGEALERERTSAPVVAMIEALPAGALDELERAARYALAPAPPSPSEIRERQIGYLAELVAVEMASRLPENGRPPRVPRNEYERTRPPGAASSRALAERHGSWLKACRAAHGLAGGGRIVGDGKPWATPSLGRRRRTDFTREEVIDAVVVVARRLDCEPGTLTSNAYYGFVAEMRRRSKARGAAPPSWPTQRSIERFFASWREVRAAVGLIGITEPAGSRRTR